MGFLNIGSLNINGATDLGKRMLLAKLIEQKSLQISFLQETYSDVKNESEWGQVFVFMNVYAPNGGADRLRFFNILKNELLK